LQYKDNFTVFAKAIHVFIRSKLGKGYRRKPVTLLLWLKPVELA